MRRRGISIDPRTAAIMRNVIGILYSAVTPSIMATMIAEGIAEGEVVVGVDDILEGVLPQWAAVYLLSGGEKR